MNYTKRPATKRDRALLFDLNKRAMKEHVIENFGVWDERQQLQIFEETTDLSLHDILMDGEVPFGFVNVVERDNEIHINRLCITPEYQSRGIGTAVIEGLIEMSGPDRSLKLQLFPKNPAYRLYRHMGFKETKTTSTRIHMVRTPDVRKT